MVGKCTNVCKWCNQNIQLSPCNGMKSNQLYVSSIMLIDYDWILSLCQVRVSKPKIDPNQQTSLIKSSSASSIPQGYFYTTDFCKSISVLLLPQIFVRNFGSPNLLPAIAFLQFPYSNSLSAIANCEFSILSFKNVLPQTFTRNVPSRNQILDCGLSILLPTFPNMGFHNFSPVTFLLQFNFPQL